MTTLEDVFRGMHRHNTYVSHVGSDHDHGVCSEHAHYAGGSHPSDTPLESERHNLAREKRNHARRCYEEADRLRELATKLDLEGLDAESDAYDLEPW